MAFRIIAFSLFFLFFSTSTFAQAMRNDLCPVGSWCHLESDTELGTQLLRASFTGDLAETRRLIDEGANVNTRGLRGAGDSAVCRAIQTSVGHPVTSSYTAAYRSVVKLLIDHGADAHGCMLGSVNDLQIVKLALTHGADPNDGDPILPAMSMWSWDIKNWTAVIKLLLDAGADPNVRDISGRNMLFVIPSPTPPNSKLRVSENDTAQLFKLFIEHGARINDTAAYIGDRECGYPVTKLGGMQLCWALNEDKQGCHVPVVPCAPERLKTFDSGNTPLMNAAGWLAKSEFRVKLLLSAGADPTLKNAEGCTALDLAGTPAIHQLLVESMRSRIGGAATELPPSTCKPAPATFSFKLAPPVGSTVKAPEPLTLDKIDLLCYRSPVAWRTALNPNASTAFGNKRILSINIVDPANLLIPQSTAEITREILFSIALWRRMCTQCTLANAAVVEIGGKTYVDERLLGIVQSFDFDNSHLGGKSLLDPSAPPNVNTLAGFYGDARLSQMVPLAEYRETSQTDLAIQHLCSGTREKSPTEFLGVREAFQCSGEPKPLTASLQIKILDGPTKCGSSKAIVGCESADLNIELNAHEYTFVQHGTSKPIFGMGQDTADLQVLMLHETGHWAGIYAHLTSPKNIMSAYLDECICINQAVIDQLGRSTLGVQRNRPFALLYKRPHSPTVNIH
jgi:ankyrin repeat protein